MSEELRECPFCGKPFVLHQPKPGVTAFQHYSEECPLHEREMQFVNLPMETMTAMLNTRPVEDQLRAIVAEQEDWLNHLLQPGMRWVELLAGYKAAGEYQVEWWTEHGPSLDLARQRLIEALAEVAGKMRRVP